MFNSHILRPLKNILSFVYRHPINYHFLIFVVSFFIAFMLNTNFNHAFNTHAIQSDFSYLVWVGIPIHASIIALILELVCWSISIKPLLCIILLLSSICGFYMESLGLNFNEDIIQSVFETHMNEALDMINMGLLSYVCIYGILPCILVILIQLKKYTILRALTHKILALMVLISFFSVAYVSFGKDIVFVFKSHKPLSTLPNPIAPIRSLVQYIGHSKERHIVQTFIAQDATLDSLSPPQVVVLFIGESARAANFFLNGYPRNTNPYTSQILQHIAQDSLSSQSQDSEKLISFTQFYSCGVITAISVPCMLTHYTQQTYTSRNLSLYTNNILDIAQSAGYEVWYLGNNGGNCVGGCDRNIDNSHKKIYAGDSIDGVMLPDVKQILKQLNNAHSKTQRIFLIMHGYGSHGASYYTRYPPNFEHFTPVCKQKELSKCTQDEIRNAYDNTLLYSDYVLAQTIQILKQLKVRSLLWYVSDHGESLGEYGQYMHGGLGYTFAPKVQKHIPSLLWFSKGWGSLPQIFESRKNETLNHDYIFHTLLHLLGIKTKDYDESLDIAGKS